MNDIPTELREIARKNAPAAMPEGLRLRLLRAMADEDVPLRSDDALPRELRERMLLVMENEAAELQADAALEHELRAVYAAAPMPVVLQQRLPKAMQAAVTRSHRSYVRRLVGAAAAVVLLAGVLVWFMPSHQSAAAPMVKMTRQVTTAEGGCGTVRCDTFVMEGADRSRLVIRVEEPEKSQLPDDVI